VPIGIATLRSYTRSVSLTLNQFKSDRYGQPALDALEAHPVPTQRLLDLLNDPANEQRMVHAEELDRPPMAGIIHLIRRSPARSAHERPARSSASLSRSR
jgi:hypothetical protein